MIEIEGKELTIITNKMHGYYMDELPESRDYNLGVSYLIKCTNDWGCMEYGLYYNIKNFDWNENVFIKDLPHLYNKRHEDITIKGLEAFCEEHFKTLDLPDYGDFDLYEFMGMELTDVEFVVECKRHSLDYKRLLDERNV